FAKYPDVDALAVAQQGDVESIIKSTGFFRVKAKSIIAMALAVVEKHNERIPADMASLTQLPGVGRKTANVVLGNAFDVDEGVVVDTHVARLSKRLDFSREADAVKIERDLMGIFPRERWTLLSHLLIWHGRRVCFARKPNCAGCAVSALCPSAFRV
ncbi:MAG: endonuclease III domain-containing protein, partial [Gemmatimonadaceae bacterium]